MSVIRRSIACKEGRHDPRAEAMRGQTFNLGRTCAGYAGGSPCVCPCHIDKYGKRREV